MDDVDAVDWGVRADAIAVARKNIVSILSSNLKEKLHISLPFKLWGADINSNCTIRVDSIRWLRSDCIVVGCLQQAMDGTEETYVVQVITSQDGNFINASSVPIVVHFSDFFVGIVDDIMPFGRGPHLLVCYLREWALAVFANRKNTSDQISLVSWSNANSGPAFVEILRDVCLPRIDLQENDNENLVLGLCVGKASVGEKVEVNLEEGAKGRKELSPHFILLCLTLDGKLIMYHMSSVVGSLHPVTVSSLSDDEEDSFATGPLHTVKQLPVDQEPSKVMKASQIEGSQLPKKEIMDLSVIDSSLNQVLNTRQIPTSETAERNREEKHIFSMKSSDINQKELISSKETSEGPKCKHWDNEELKQLNFKNRVAPIPSNVNLSEIEKLETVDINSSTEQFGKQNLSDSSSLLNTRGGKDILEVGKRTPEKPGSTTIWGTPTRLASINIPTTSGGYGVRPVFQSPGTFSSTSVTISTSVDPVNMTEGLLRKNGSRPSSAQNSADRTTRVGQKDSVRAGRTGASPATHPSQGTIALTKSQRDFSPSMVDHRNIALPGRLNEPKLSKNNGSVKDMVDDMDKLLKRIVEEVEGFKAACVSDQNNLLESLEEGLEALFDGSKMWKGYMDQQLEEILHLLDRTVQALVRKVYMEGIINQTTDGRYWDLWQRQRLSSELEVRRKNILKMSENLIDQVSDLEKHFNALEVNRFGGNEGGSMSHRILLSRSAASGNIQSLRAVQNAMTSQLAAAEQLSERLSRQMATLSMKSEEVKREDFRKQLFNTIGIPYDGEDLDSPEKAERIAKLPTGNSFLSLCSIRDKPWRNEAVVRSQEPETSRRRRDSLGQSLSTFEPPKTTIKRMALHNEHQNIGSSFSSMEKRLVSPVKLEVESPEDQTMHSTVLHGQKTILNLHKKVASGSSPSSLFTWNKDLSETTQGGKMRTHSIPTKYKNNAAVFSQETTKLVVCKDPSFEKETHESTADKPGPELSYMKRYESIPTKEIRGSHSDILGSKVESVSGRVPPQKFSLPRSSGETLLPKREATTLMQPGGENLEQRSSADMSSLSARSNPKSLVIPFSVDLSATSFKFSAPTVDAISEIDSTPTWAKPVSSMSSLPVYPSSGSIPPNLSPLDLQYKSRDALPDLGSARKVSPSPAAAVVSDGASSSQAEKPSSIVPLSEEHLPSPAGDVVSASKVPPSAAAAVFSNEASNSQAEKLSSIVPLAKEYLPSPVGGNLVRSVVDSTADVEDEMDEEASETSQTIDLSLGSLNGLGMSSTPSLSESRPNPFGGSFATPVNGPSSFAMSTASNDLFRPASLSFQSLQPSLQTQQAVVGSVSWGFGASNAAHASGGSGFGQPSQIGPGQQALGSVLGSFGQSRQLGSFGQPSQIGPGGFPAPQSATGFANAAAASGGSPAAGAAGTGGFAGAAAGTGGFAAAAAGTGGFAAAAAGTGGFAGAAGGFSGQATGGAGFGAFSTPGAGGFTTFGSGAGGSRPISSDLFTQMRK
ncbi:hypothetical protein Dimus_011602 [Dionaea muscipula]